MTQSRLCSELQSYSAWTIGQIIMKKKIREMYASEVLKLARIGRDDSKTLVMDKVSFVFQMLRMFLIVSLYLLTCPQIPGPRPHR